MTVLFFKVFFFMIYTFLHTFEPCVIELFPFRLKNPQNMVLLNYVASNENKSFSRLNFHAICYTQCDKGENPGPGGGIHWRLPPLFYKSCKRKQRSGPPKNYGHGGITPPPPSAGQSAVNKFRDWPSKASLKQDI